MTTPQSTSTKIFRAGFLLIGWSLSRKIYKDYGKRAFWLSYCAGSAFVSYHTWSETEETWQRIKELWAEKKKAKERQAALREAIAMTFGPTEGTS